MYARLFKLNPYHDALGRFTSRDGSRFTSIGGAFSRSNARDRAAYEKTRGVSLKATRTARHWERKIAGDAFETGVAIDARGNVLLAKGGSRGAVTFTPEEVRHLKKSGVGVFTHNHPGKTKGFSEADIGFTHLIGAKQVRVVAGDQVIALTFPEAARSNPDWFRTAGRSLWREREEDTLNLFSEQIHQGTRTLAEADRDHHPRITRLFAERIGADLQVETL
jgi:hypothetical protein